MPWFSICANCAKISDDNPLIRQYLKCQTIRPSQFMIEQCTNYYLWANCIKKRLLYSMIIGCSYFSCARTSSNTAVHLCLTMNAKLKLDFELSLLMYTYKHAIIVQFLWVNIVKLQNHTHAGHVALSSFLEIWHPLHPLGGCVQVKTGFCYLYSMINHCNKYPSLFKINFNMHRFTLEFWPQIWSSKEFWVSWLTGDKLKHFSNSKHNTSWRVSRARFPGHHVSRLFPCRM